MKHPAASAAIGQSLRSPVGGGQWQALTNDKLFCISG
jgi:hypothetical protein